MREIERDTRETTGTKERLWNQSEGLREQDKMGKRYRERFTPVRVLWLLGIILEFPMALLTDGRFDATARVRFALLLIVVLTLASLLLHALRRRIAPEPNTLANLLTLSRLVVGCALAAFVLSGARDRMASASILLWVLAVLSATLLDWLDGPIARKEGPTRIGAVLDIESDSWLTLWCAGAAVALGGLPWIVLLPPIVRYIHPLLDLRAGRLPAGGGPWWCRATGVAQMTLLIAAFAPVTGPARDAILAVVVWPVSLAQLATMLALLALRRR